MLSCICFNEQEVLFAVDVRQYHWLGFKRCLEQNLQKKTIFTQMTIVMQINPIIGGQEGMT